MGKNKSERILAWILAAACIIGSAGAQLPVTGYAASVAAEAEAEPVTAGTEEIAGNGSMTDAGTNSGTAQAEAVVLQSTGEQGTEEQDPNAVYDITGQTVTLYADNTDAVAESVSVLPALAVRIIANPGSSRDLSAAVNYVSEEDCLPYLSTLKDAAEEDENGIRGILGFQIRIVKSDGSLFAPAEGEVYHMTLWTGDTDALKGTKLYRVDGDICEEVQYTVVEDVIGNYITFDTGGQGTFLFASENVENTADLTDTEQTEIKNLSDENTDGEQKEETGVHEGTRDTGSSEEQDPGESQKQDPDGIIQRPEENTDDLIVTETPDEEEEITVATPETEYMVIGDAQEEQDDDIIMNPDEMKLRKGADTGDGETEMEGGRTITGDHIKKLTVKWLSRSTDGGPAGTDTLRVTAALDKLPNFQFQIDFTMEGEGEVEAGGIELRFPASIFKTRDGNEMGELTLSVPEDPDTGSEYTWKRIGDEIVLSNAYAMPVSSKVMIQGTWRTSVNHRVLTYAHEMVDKDGGGKSDVMKVSMDVRTDEWEEQAESNGIDATIDTSVRAAIIGKTAYDFMTGLYTIYKSAEQAKAAGLPDDFAQQDDCVYAKWYISAGAMGTQPYTISVHDDGADEYGCRVLGYSEPQVTAGADIEIFSGYSSAKKYAYAWTAWPRSAFEDGKNYTLHNTATVNAVGMDDGIPVTNTVAAEAVLYTPVTWTIRKHWDDDNNAAQRRPDTVSCIIKRRRAAQGGEYKIWETVTLTDRGDGIYEYQWTDDQVVYEYSVTENYGYRGTISSGYDRYGYPVSTEWMYSTSSQTYDPETHTWDITNRYHVANRSWTRPYTTSRGKHTAFAYEDPDQMSVRNRVLNELLNGNEVYIPFSVSNAMPYAKFDDDSTLTAYIEDTEYFLDDQPVPDGSVCFHTVSTDRSTLYARGQYNEETGYYNSYGIYGKSDVRIYGNSGGEWVLYGIRGETFTAQNGASVTEEGELQFPDGVTGIRAESDTPKNGISMYMQVKMKIKPTDAVLDLIREKSADTSYPVLSLTNRAKTGAGQDTGSYCSATAYLHGRTHTVRAYAGDRIEYLYNDINSRKIMMHVRASVTQNSNVLDWDDYVSDIENGVIPNTKSGTFYDLLPMGIIPDLSTISVSNGSLRNAYIMKSFRAGRTMLVIEMDMEDNYYESSNGYSNSHTVEFDCAYPWDEALSYGLGNVRNLVAYAADEDWIGSERGWIGECDDASGTNHIQTAELGADAPLMANLQGRDTPSFVYAASLAEIPEIDFYARTSFQTMVSTGGIWTDGAAGDAVAEEFGSYTYKLVAYSSEESTTKDIIFIDAIEQYKPEGAGETWHGTLESVDVSQPLGMGAAPVVYYATEPVDPAALNPEAKPDVVRSIITNWTTKPEDMSAVTCIAVDCSRDAAGNEYVLPENKALIVYLNMRATAEIETLSGNAADNAKAYNIAYMDCNMVAGAAGENREYKESSYAQTWIRGYNINVETSWDDENDNDGLRPGSVAYTLYANGTEIRTETLKDGNGTFERVPAHDPNGVPYTYRLESNVSGYTMTASFRNGKFRVVQTHVPEKADIHIEKQWEYDNEATRPQTIQIRLFANGQYYGQHVVSERNGRWETVFADLPLYKGRKPVTYTYDEIVPENYVPYYDGFLLTNRYYPYGNLKITRTVNGSSAAMDREAVYTLTLSGEDGRDVTAKYRYTKGNTEGMIGNGETFTLKHGEALTVYDIPTDIVYEVSEDPMHGFEPDTPSNASGHVTAGTDTDVRFYSDYHASGLAALQAETTVDGKPLTDGMFTFNIYSGDTLAGIAKCDRNGDVRFSSLKFTDVNDGKQYAYYIREKNEGKGGYTYDGAETCVLVDVTDTGDGNLTFRISEGYRKDIVTQTRYKAEFADGYTVYADTSDAFDMDGLKSLHGEGNVSEDERMQFSEEHHHIFRNTYRASGNLQIRAYKQYPDLAAEQFTFRLAEEGSEGAPMTAKNDADGLVLFDPIPYTQEDIGKEIRMIAEEVIPEPDDADPAVYDTAKILYRVTVEDNDDGTLSFRAKTFDAADGRTEKEPVFVNRQKDGTLTVKCESSRDATFTLHLRISDDTISSVPYKAPGASAYTDLRITDKEATFTLRTGKTGSFTLPAGCTYNLTVDSLPGYITESRENTSGIVQPAETINAVFHNAYRPGMTSVQLFAECLLDNRHTDTPFDVTLVSGNETLQSVKSGDNGIAEFAPLEFTSSGRYTYTIRELPGDDPSIRYDGHDETVTITVSSRMSATVKYSGGRALFRNTHYPGTLRITKWAEGITNANKDIVFPFDIKMSDAPDKIIWYSVDATTGEFLDEEDEASRFSKR